VELRLIVTLGTLVIIPAVLFSVIYKVADSRAGFPQLFGDDFAASQKALSDNELKNRRYCIDGVTDESDPRCVVGDAQAPSSALMIGDSFSNQYMASMDVMGKDANVSVTALSTSACLSLPDVYLGRRVVPSEVKSLLQSGKLSTKKMPAGSTTSYCRTMCVAVCFAWAES
jgi:hypothetical protein